jgi:hypothetical protein
MAEAEIVPRGTVSRSRLWHLRGGNELTSPRSLVNDSTSLLSAPTNAALTPATDLAGVGTYAGRRSRDTSQPQHQQQAMMSSASPTYSEIMSPHSQQQGPPTFESAYEPYVPPVHYEGYFPPVFDVPDSRYAALGVGAGAGLGAAAAARDPFADVPSPTTDETAFSGSTTDNVATAPYAQRAALGPRFDADRAGLPHVPFVAQPVVAAVAPVRSQRGSVGSVYATPDTAPPGDASSSGSSGPLIFATPAEYAPTFKRQSSHTGYGDWLRGGAPSSVAASFDDAGATSSQLAAHSAAGGAFPFPTIVNRSGGSGGTLETIPERHPEGFLRPPNPTPGGPETPAGLSDESDYATARRLTVSAVPIVPSPFLNKVSNRSQTSNRYGGF